MKRKLAIAGLIAPGVVGLIWMIINIIFSSAAQTTNQSIAHGYLNIGLGIAMIVALVSLIVGVVIIGKEKILSHSEIIGQSRSDMRKNMAKFILGLLLLFVFQMFQNTLSDERRPFTLLSLVLIIVVGILYLWIDLGIRQLALNVVHQKVVKVSQMFVDLKKLGKYIVAYILIQISVVIGLIAFVLPGIIVSLRLILVPYLILDKNLGIIESIKTSWHATKGYGANIFSLNVVLGLINILGLLAVVVGLLWTIPLFYIANAYIYKRLIAAHHNK